MLGGCHERPVFFPYGALCNPLAEQFDLFGGQLPIGFDGWHAVRGIQGRNTVDQFALQWRVGSHYRWSVPFSEKTFLTIEAELRGAPGTVAAVTAKTSIREDGPDVTLEINPSLATYRRRAKQQQATPEVPQTLGCHCDLPESKYKRGLHFLSRLQRHDRTVVAVLIW